MTRCSPFSCGASPQRSFRCNCKEESLEPPTITLEPIPPQPPMGETQSALEKLENWKKTLNVLKGHRPTVAGLLGDPKLAKIGVLSGPNLGKFGLLGSPKLATFGLLGAHNWPYSVFAAAQNWPKLAAINQQLFWRLARAWDANMCAQSGVW
eukprot:CAMPEP_0174354496 /NCGR_PEP_ID=MMETSP0811_2-20130205/19892_1 /TAXON_ID=73025 ORGANISM="Eutreptiella gymnastica-like, Strain CCMP1594" /NCGR_SAMPLE_ID=MMETSP0811_2 /ASSEMBLY_ACC=CAM_ASM_000667 /LENGTH=151 /DNA_ID=CAMNT_0015485391 /DNA_START=149 /DNA_END=602 /DNA_ORIENTATION=+